MMMRVCLLTLLLIACSSNALLPHCKRRLALLALPLAFAMPVNALANPASTAPLFMPMSSSSSTGSSSSSSSMTFSEFLVELEAGKFAKVVFKGTSPTYLTAYRERDSETAGIIVKEGFPAFDDPKSPSGPTQAIAKCQHTPGVVCVQDVTDLLKMTKRGGSSRVSSPRPLLQHAAYPKELEYDR